MDSGVEYYSLDELENVGEKIKSLVADVGSMKEKVARGVQYAEDMWSWKHWAVEFVEAAKECWGVALETVGEIDIVWCGVQAGASYKIVFIEVL